MQLPGPVRAVVGLIATAADEARHLPDRVIELPMLAIGSALQVSLRAQQQYARLAARGDDVINRRPVADDPPPWATFDDPVPAGPETAEAPDPDTGTASRLLDDLLGTDDAGPERAPHDTDAAPPAKRSTTRKPPAADAGPKNPPAKRAAAKTPAKKQPAKGTKGGQEPGKTINKPRHTTPSRFDTIDDQ